VGGGGGGGGGGRVPRLAGKRKEKGRDCKGKRAGPKTMHKGHEVVDGTIIPSTKHLKRKTICGRNMLRPKGKPKIAGGGQIFGYDSGKDAASLRSERPIHKEGSFPGWGNRERRSEGKRKGRVPMAVVVKKGKGEEDNLRKSMDGDKKRQLISVPNDTKQSVQQGVSTGPMSRDKN